MGLDLSIRYQTDFKTDNKGRTSWTTLELANFRNCWEILDRLNNRLEDGFGNCATWSFYGETFYEILEELKESMKEWQDKDVTKSRNSDAILTENQIKYMEERKEEKIKQLEYEIEKLKEFINENKVENSDSDSFEVHAWW